MECGDLLASPQDQRRKPATVLFCDIAGSTALAERIDPEAIRELMVAYFHEMRIAIEAHGGTVEKFIGDAVVGVFGVPIAHEDDALRGVRAAAEMRERLAVLNEDLERRFGARLSLRIGVNTGEVVAGDPTARESFVSGDTVNVAARLEQAAGADGVLLGETTHALVARAVEAEAQPPLSVKGKTLPLRSYRFVRVRREVEPAPGRSSRFVGREPELELLGSLIGLVRSSGAPVRALVLGEAGVGKSRLVTTALESAGPDVGVLSVRCLPYGEDITYFPLAQLVRQAAAIREGDDLRAARDRIERVFADTPDAGVAPGILAQVLGHAEGSASADEIAWAARRLLEIMASDRPLVLQVDDLQWAEEPFVDLLMDTVRRGRKAILVLCLARPEFAARRPDWTADVRLQPLSSGEARRFLLQLPSGSRLASDSQARLLAASGGNPLFLEELVAYLAATGEEMDLPPTLDALLTARLDARPAQERRTLECAAIEGEVFHRGAVLLLAVPELESRVDGALARLADDSIVRRGKSTFENEEAFQFHHLLVRDAAYRGTSKRRRAGLHLLFAGWLEGKLGARVVEAAEIVAYHLEQVCHLRAELGPLDEDTRAVGARAADLLVDTARRSLARGDAGAALSLFTRAAVLAPAESTQFEIALGRGIAAREASELVLSETVLEAVARDATRAGFDLVAARARLELALTQLHLRPVETAPLLQLVAERALETFEERDDDLGRALALFVLAQGHWHALRLAEEERLLERALVHAERAQDDRLIAAILVPLARSVLFGPRSAAEAVPRFEELLVRAQRIGPTIAATVTVMLGVLEAIRGRAIRARELVRSSLEVLEESASPLAVASALSWAGLAESTLGDAERAERHLRRSFDLHERFSERGVGSTAAALLARALVDLGRVEESERLASLALDWSSEGDIATQAYARSARALALVARGAVEEGRREALAAVDLSAGSDFANQRGNASLDLAVVLRACGDEPGARRAAAEAQAYFADKGNIVAAERAASLATP
jgi:class 3 adenylate cyclase/tetratricopeptide (TPR) repeat protein